MPGAIANGLALRNQPVGPGAIVLGLGIFPGLSNLLARALFDAHDRKVGWSSRCGSHLMVEPAPYFIDGQRRFARAFSAGPTLFLGRDRGRSLLAAIPETNLLHASTGARDLTVSLSPTPDILQPLLRVAARIAPKGHLARSAYLALWRGGEIGASGGKR